MDLYVVRHAIAFERDPARWPDDSKRPLTPEGELRFRRAARGLARIAPEVDVLLSSPFARAWRTAEILEDRAGWPAARRCDALASDHPPQQAVEALTALAPVGAVGVVGHEPHLHLLISLLLAGDPERVHVELKKGAVAALRVEGDLRPGSASLRWVLPPRTLRSLRKA